MRVKREKSRGAVQLLVVDMWGGLPPKSRTPKSARPRTSNASGQTKLGIRFQHLVVAPYLISLINFGGGRGGTGRS